MPHALLSYSDEEVGDVRSAPDNLNQGHQEEEKKA
jgi:hypothetical protein